MTEPDPAALLELHGLSKSFDGQVALADVDLGVRKGEIHALLGTNGSGKSTLIKVLAGYHPPDPGARAVLGGQELRLGAPPGPGVPLRFIHQDLALVDDLSVADNMGLVSDGERRWWLSPTARRRRTATVLADLGIDLDPDTLVGELSRAEQTMLAIARAVGSGLGSGALLVLDEPTAALPAPEVRLLFDLLRSLRSRGVGIIFVTHRLPEVLELADRVTVLRDGRRVVTRPVEGLDHEALVELLLGRVLPPHQGNIASTDGGPVVLELRGLHGRTVHDVSLAVRAGQIVGVTGLVGSGYDELLGLAFGGTRARAGSTHVDGVAVTPLTAARSIRHGIGYAPADRKHLSTLPDWSLRENLTLPALRSRGPARWLSPRTERVDARRHLTDAGVVPALPEKMIRLLSGGNQQKVVVARWLRAGARALLLDEPTNGIDTGAKRALYDVLRAIADEGTAVLLTSQDPEELCAICDVVVVLVEGRVHSVLHGSSITEGGILAASLSTHESRGRAS